MVKCNVVSNSHLVLVVRKGACHLDEFTAQLRISAVIKIFFFFLIVIPNTGRSVKKQVEVVKKMGILPGKRIDLSSRSPVHNVFLPSLLQENGYLVMVYDIGTGVHRLVEEGRRFDDGQYHYVSFVRSGANATMRVDDFPRQTYNQAGTLLG